MRLKHRVVRLTRIFNPAQVNPQDALDAAKRVTDSALAKVEAFLAGKPLPQRDPDEEQRDYELLDRWHRQNGIPKEPDEAAKELFAQKIEALARNGTTFDDLRRMNQERTEL